MIMEIKLLGKKLEEYQQTDYCESEIMRRQFNAEFALHNIRAVKNRLADRFENECYDHFLMEGNALKTSNQIIAMVRVSLALSLLTDEQWEKAIPIIERGLNANIAYTKMLDEISPIFERYCSEWKDVCMRNTFDERIHLECWQGRFSEHWCNPEQKPNYM